MEVLIRVSLLVIVFGISACGKGIDGGETASPPAKETVFAVDGVKLISSEIARGDDAQTFSQRTFSIKQNSRLLIRYENLLSQVSQVREDYPMRLRVFISGKDDTDLANAHALLKVCPVEKSWMMAASWTAAHPWQGGSWPAGGSFDDTACVGVEVQKVSAKVLESTAVSIACTEPRAVCFDVTKWFQVWVRERGENLGLILILDPSAPAAAGATVSVVGDASPGKAPRIHWFETKKSW